MPSESLETLLAASVLSLTQRNLIASLTAAHVRRSGQVSAYAAIGAGMQLRRVLANEVR